MQKTIVILPLFYLAGITARTNNRNELDAQNGKIVPCIQKYFDESIGEKIPNDKNKGTTYCLYTDYESDFTGEYTFLIGKQITTSYYIPKDLEVLVIPSQTYVKFTYGPGPMPNIVQQAWQEIWQMSPEELGGMRSYIADFEVYDERASDQKNTILDIYIGIRANKNRKPNPE
jgi:predicted transcriptional regulator YdeE